MTFGSLFAGIGGLDLGLERAGMTCKFQVEIDPYACRVLAKHWPDVPRHNDIRTFPAADTLDEWRALKVDLICGGFPCQDISYAGKGAGLEGEKSGLWFEYARVVRVLRPRFVLVENVSALLVRGIDRVLGTLAEMGYDAEWGCVSAASVGAPHIRDRVFVLAYANGKRLEIGKRVGSDPSAEFSTFERNGQDVPDADQLEHKVSPHEDRGTAAAILSGRPEPDQWWATEPDVGRVAHGIPSRVDRLRGLGNAVVPQVAEWIGRQIMAKAT